MWRCDELVEFWWQWHAIEYTLLTQVFQNFSCLLVNFAISTGIWPSTIGHIPVERSHYNGEGGG